jgi:hypothetical protein
MAHRLPDRLGRPSWGGFDVAQVCLNGHVTNAATEANASRSQDFCDRCGVKTTTTCNSCGTPIRGLNHSSNVVRQFEAPAYCSNCGRPFEWTSARLQAAKSLADEVTELNESERLLLKASIDDLLCDTPNAEVAALRFKKYVAKGGKELAAAFKAVLYDIAAEGVKKSIWGP